MNLDSTIVAISTPPGEGGVGLVRLSGPQAMDIGRQLFHSQPPLGKRIRRVEYGRVMADGHPIDQGLAWVLKGPHSYTGEDTVEISCHGSPLILETLIQEALGKGAVLAAPGEFTRRAFLNGRLDLLQAEAVIDLVRAGTQHHLDNAYGHASGRLSERIRQLKDLWVKALSRIEVGLDFAEEDIPPLDYQQLLQQVHQATREASSLAETFEGARRRQQGYLVALIGRPNVGKSTLLNTLLAEDRAIVTPFPGTTRDLIEGRAIWNGETVRLVDTAGMRFSSDPIEQEGIDRAHKLAASADLVLAVLDSSVEWHEEDRPVLECLRHRAGLVVLNKSDLPRRLRLVEPWQESFSCVEISALTGMGADVLQQVASELLPRPTLVDGVGITRQRHQNCLLRAVGAGERAIALLEKGHVDECVALELQEALGALGEMLGENAGEEVLDRIFADFCVGK